jgi:hypothetical protein
MKRVAVPTLMRKLALLVESCSETVNTEFAHLRKDQLDWQPNEKSWSISQCLAHLNASKILKIFFQVAHLELLFQVR